MPALFILPKLHQLVKSSLNHIINLITKPNKLYHRSKSKMVLKTLLLPKPFHKTNKLFKPKLIFKLKSTKRRFKRLSLLYKWMNKLSLRRRCSRSKLASLSTRLIWTKTLSRKKKMNSRDKNRPLKTTKTYCQRKWNLWRKCEKRKPRRKSSRNPRKSKKRRVKSRMPLKRSERLRHSLRKIWQRERQPSMTPKWKVKPRNLKI